MTTLPSRAREQAPAPFPSRDRKGAGILAPLQNRAREQAPAPFPSRDRNVEQAIGFCGLLILPTHGFPSVTARERN
jgi:hypothetical protein